MTDTLDSRLAQVANIFGPNYSNVIPFAQGSTRDVYLADWTPDSYNTNGPKQKRILKHDRRDVDNDKVRKNLSRGYGTRREVERLMRLVDPEKHNIVRVLEVVDDGFGGLATAETYIPGSESLESRVKSSDGGKLSRKDFVKVFNDVLEAVSYSHKNDLMHRDLTPRNILVTEEFGGRVTDFTLSQSIGSDASDLEEVSPSQATHFGSSMTDPRIMAGGKYDVRAEIYAIGANMYYALTGEFLKHDEKLKNSLKKVPRKWRSLVERCVTPDLSDRFRDVKELSYEFSQRKKTLSDVQRGIGVLGMILGFSIGGAFIGADTKEKDLEKRLAEAEKFEVRTDYNGEGLEWGNTLVDVSATAYYYGKDVEKGTRPFFDDYNGKGDFIQIPLEELDPNKKISITVRAKERPGRPNKGIVDLRSLPGRIYFEGYDGREFGVMVSSFNDSWKWEAYHGDGTYPMELELPPLSEFGKVRNIAVEVYAPDQNEPDPRNGNGKVNFFKPGTIISRFRIPVIIGDKLDYDIPSNAVNLSTFNLDRWGSDRMYFRRVDDRQNGYIGKIGEPLRAIMSIPEDNFLKNTNHRGDTLYASDGGGLNTWGFPEINQEASRTLTFGVYDTQGSMITYTGVPIVRRDTRFRNEESNEKNEPPIYNWLIDEAPDKNLYQRLKIGFSKIPRRIEPLKDDDKK